MAWKVILTKKAERELKKFDSKILQSIRKTFKIIEKLDDPRELGYEIMGFSGELWSYRIENYCHAICKIKDRKIILIFFTEKFIKKELKNYGSFKTLQRTFTDHVRNTRC